MGYIIINKGTGKRPIRSDGEISGYHEHLADAVTELTITFGDSPYLKIIKK